MMHAALRSSLTVLALALAAATVLPLSSCGGGAEAVKADAVDVTYYYLPG